jgi:hypothetical protein
MKQLTKTPAPKRTQKSVRLRERGGRGGKYGPRLPFKRDNISVRMHEQLIPVIGRIAYSRGLATTALIERLVFDVVAAEQPETARAIAVAAPEFFQLPAPVAPRSSTCPSPRAAKPRLSAASARPSIGAEGRSK